MKMVKTGGWVLFVLAAGLLIFWLSNWQLISRLHQDALPPSMSFVEKEHPALAAALKWNDIDLGSYPFGEDSVLAAKILNLSFFQQIYFSLMLYCLAMLTILWPGDGDAVNSTLRRCLRGLLFVAVLGFLAMTIRSHVQYADLLDLIPPVPPLATLP